MSAQDGRRYKLSDFSRFVVALFNLMQRLQSNGLLLRTLFIPSRDLRVKVPAIEIKGTVSTRGRIFDELFDVRLRLFLQVQETNDDIRNLHSGVVDVVLDINVVPGSTEQADESVAQD